MFQIHYFKIKTALILGTAAFSFCCSASHTFAGIQMQEQMEQTQTVKAMESPKETQPEEAVHPQVNSESFLESGENKQTQTDTDFPFPTDDMRLQEVVQAGANSLFAKIADGSITDGFYIRKVYASEMTSASKTYQAIQRALDEAASHASSSRPYKIVIEPGSYELKKSLHIYSNTCLFMERVTLTQTTGVKSNMIKVGDTNDTRTGYYYKNITIDGGTLGGTLNENGNSSTTVKVAHTKNFSMSGITLRNTVDAHLMEVAGVNGFSLTHCTFLDQVLKNTLYYEAVQFDILVSAHLKGYASEVLANKNISVSNCTFQNVPRGIGSHTSILNVPISNIEITNNLFCNLGSAAIQLMNCNDCTIRQNTITNCPRGIIFYTLRLPPEGTYLASTITQNSGISSNYITPKKKQKIVIEKNHITCSGLDTFDPTYERAGIFLGGYNYTSAVTPTDGDTIPAGDYYLSGVTVRNNDISTSQHGIILQNTKNSKITENTIRFTESGSQIGIYLRNSSTENRIADNKINGCAGTSIFISGKSSVSSISGNTIHSSGQCGIYATDSSVTKIKDNVIKSPGTYGIHCNAATISSIHNNNIKSAASYGIIIADGKVSKVSGNQIESCGLHSIAAYRNTAIEKITKNTIRSGKGYGISIGQIACDLEISSNTIKKCHDMQIYLNPESKKNKITLNGNQLHGTSTEYGIFVDSGNIILSKNTMKQFLIPIQICDTAKCTVAPNTFKKNEETGIRVTDALNVYSYTQYLIPDKPTALTATASKKSVIRLSWNKVSGADGYYIYRSDSQTGTYEKIASVKSKKGSSYNDKKLSKKKTYYYKIAAYKKSSNKNVTLLSSYSKTVRATSL